MNTTVTDRRQQLRKVAILVATLDEALAQQLLADLPAREAAAVMTMVEELESIDPSEYRAVVDDFQRGLGDQIQQAASEQQPARVDGVELDESLLARLDAQEDYAAAATTPVVSAPWNTLSDADADILAEMLSAEQPQTIAVVMSRLEPGRAAELIAKLSPALQVEVLTRLSELDPADQQALQVVESQLATWITQQRERKQRMAAGRDMVERILQNTPDNQRVAIMTQMNKRAPALTAELSARPPVSQTPRLPAAELGVYQTAPKVVEAATPTQEQRHTESDDPLSELEALDDRQLLAALSYSDREVVMLALAGASDSFMKRILRGLPRRQANQFRQQVRAIGPTRLGDMLAAQRELVRSAQNSAVN